MTAQRACCTGRFLPAIALCLLLGGCVALPAASVPPVEVSPEAEARYRVVATKDGDVVTVTQADGDVEVDVRSETGIGSAEIVRAGPPPTALRLSFHLKSLEELRFTYGDTRLFVYVATTGNTVREELGPEGAQPRPITQDSEYWMPVQQVSTGGQGTEKVIEVSTSPNFIRSQPARFSFKWIDFYR